MANANMTTVVGVFKDYATAQAVVQELEGSGFPTKNIHVTNVSEGALNNAPSHLTKGEGGLTGFFDRLFGSNVDEDETRYYEKVVQRGNAVVTLDVVEQQLNYAVEIMDRHGALNVEKDKANSPISAESSITQDGQESIPVVEEELRVGKRVIQRGGVRVYSRIVDTPVEEQVTLREEHVRVERRPVDRAATAEDLTRLQDQTIEVTEMAEEPVVSKSARVVEEVLIGKETTQRTEMIRDSVRSTDVTVENVASQPTGHAVVDYEADFRDFEKRYPGSEYESFAPAYQYGYSIANDTRYKGKSWKDVESTVQTEYLRSNPNSTWDKVKGAVQYGWEKVTGK